MTSDVSSGWGDLGLFSLFRSPFLFPSLLLHAMLFLASLASRHFFNRATGTADLSSIAGRKRRRLGHQKHRPR